jgi:hypothetical protein
MAKIFFADEKVRKEYERLENSSEYSELYRHIKNALEDIKENPQRCGIAIQKRLIPNFYKKYGINNLFKYDLPAGWRLLYSIGKEGIEVIAIVLEWMKHKDYEKRFGYKVR